MSKCQKAMKSHEYESNMKVYRMKNICAGGEKGKFKINQLYY